MVRTNLAYVLLVLRTQYVTVPMSREFYQQTLHLADRAGNRYWFVQRHGEFHFPLLLGAPVEWLEHGAFMALALDALVREENFSPACCI